MTNEQLGGQDIDECPWCLRGIPFPAFDAHVKRCRDLAALRAVGQEGE
jgi:hypothetical protein